MTKFFLLAALGAGIVVAQTPAGNAENGKTLFNNKYRCYTCHGFDGHGGAGARLVPMKMPAVAMIAYVRAPQRMPAYGPAVISDQELTDIWAYVKTIPESPAVDKIPLLTQIQGENK